MKNKKPFIMPPRHFSNAMNDLFPNFDYTNWKDSPEFKLWQAGRKSAFDELKDKASLAIRNIEEGRV